MKVYHLKDKRTRTQTSTSMRKRTLVRHKVRSSQHIFLSDMHQRKKNFVIVLVQIRLLTVSEHGGSFFHSCLRHLASSLFNGTERHSSWHTRHHAPLHLVFFDAEAR